MASVVNKFTTTTDISTLSPSDITKLTTSEVAAFTSKQLMALDASQIAVFSNNQINVLPLKSVPADIISSISILAIPSLRVSQLSSEQFDQLDATQIAVLTSTQVATLTKTQFSGENIDHLSAFSIGNTKMPGGITGLKLSLLTPEQFGALSSEQISALTQEQIKQINLKQFKVMTADQASALTSQQIISVNSLTGLSEEAVGAISSRAISMLPTKTFAQLNALQLKALSVEQAAMLNAAQVQALKAEQIASFEAEDIAALSTKALQGLTKTNIAGIDLSTLTGENQFSSLNTKQFGYLSRSQLNQMTEEQAAQINASMLASLSSTQTNSLSDNIIAAISPAAIKGFTAKNITGLSAKAIGALNEDQIKFLPEQSVKVLTSSQISALPREDFLALPASTFKAIPANLISNIPPTVFAELSSTTIKTLSADQIAHLSNTQITQLGEDQIQGLQRSQLSKFSVEQLSKMTSNVFLVMPATLFNAIPATNIKGIPAAVFADVGSSVIKTLSAEQVGNLAPDQLSQFGEEQSAGLSVTQVGKLSGQQVGSLTTTVLNSFLTKIVQAISTVAITGISPSNIPLLSTDFVAGLSVPQLNSLSDNQWAKFTLQQKAAFTAQQMSGLTPQAKQKFDNVGNSGPTGTVTLLGTAQYHQQLTVTNTLQDENGIATNVSYQWLRNGVAISGKIGDAYVLTAADATKNISVKASYTDGLGNLESAISKPLKIDALTIEQVKGLTKEEIPGLVLTANQAANINPNTAVNTTPHSVTIKDTAGEVQKYWDVLHALNMDPPFGEIIFTDETTPTLTLSTSQINDENVADKDHGLLRFITTDYKLIISDAVAANVVSLNNNPYVDAFSITDTAANISTHWQDLEIALGKHRLTSLKVSDNGIIEIHDLYNENYAKPTEMSSKLMQFINGASAFNIYPSGLDYYGSSTKSQHSKVQSGNFYDLSTLNINLPIHIMDTGNTISVPDVLKIQEAINNGSLTDFQVDRKKAAIMWDAYRLGEIGLINSPKVFLPYGDTPTYTGIVGGKVDFTVNELANFYGSQPYKFITASINKSLGSNFGSLAIGIVKGEAKDVTSRLDNIVSLLADYVMPYDYYTGHSYMIPFDRLQLTDNFPSPITINTGQLNKINSLWFPMFNKIEEIHLISIKDTAEQLNNLNLALIANHPIEIQPTDINSNITISSAVVRDVNLTSLNLPIGSTITVKSINFNGMNSTEIDISIYNDSVRTIILENTNSNNLAVYVPPTTQINSITNINGMTELNFVLAKDVLTNAANKDVSSIKIVDTANNINKYFSDIVNVYKLGKLAKISTINNEQLNINISDNNFDGGIGNIVNIINSPLNVTINIEDKANNISRAWSQLESFINKGYKLNIYVNDGGRVLVPDLFISKENTIYYSNDTSLFFKELNQSSAAIMKSISGAGGFDISNHFLGNSYSSENNRAIPSSIYPKLSQLKSSLLSNTPFHLVDDGGVRWGGGSWSGSTIISTKDLIALQDAINQHVVEDFTFNSFKTITWLDDFSDIDLVTNGNTFKSIMPPPWWRISIDKKIDYSIDKINKIVENSGIFESMFNSIKNAPSNYGDPGVSIGGNESAIHANSNDLNQSLDNVNTFLSVIKLNNGQKIINLDDKFRPTLVVNTIQSKDDKVVLDSIIENYILSIQDNSNQLINFDLTPISNHIIEIKPKDLNNNITVSGGVVTSINLSEINVPFGTITDVKSKDINGVTSTEIDLIEPNNSVHSLTLIGTDPNKVIILSPLMANNLPSVGVAGNITNESAKNALSDATNKDVISVSIMDTAKNIESYFDDLLRIYKTGKLKEINAIDNSTLHLSFNLKDIILGNLNIIDLITDSYTLKVNSTADLSDILSNKNYVSDIYVSDTAVNISTYWDKLEIAFKSGKLKSVNVSDGKIVNVSDLFVTDGNNAYQNIAPKFSHLNFDSLNLIKLITGFSGLNIIPLFPNSSYGHDTALPSQIWSSIATLKQDINVPFHILIPGNYINIKLSTSELFFVQDAIANNIISDLTLVPTNRNGLGTPLDAAFNINWYQNDFEKIGLVNNTNVFKIDKDNFDENQYNFMSIRFNSLNITANQISGLVYSPIFQEFKKIKNFNFDMSYDEKKYRIIDSAKNIGCYLDELTIFKQSQVASSWGVNFANLPILFTDVFYPVISILSNQVAKNAGTLDAMGDGYLLSIKDSSINLNNLNISTISNHKIEIQPLDLNNDITIIGGEVSDINLSGLSCPIGTIITKNSTIINGIDSSTIYINEQNGNIHTLTLIGTNINNLKVYEPVISLVSTNSSLDLSLKSVLAKDAIFYAISPAVTLVNITDTHDNIISNLSSLLSIFKAGKLGYVRITDSNKLNLSLSNDQLIQYGGLLNKLSYLTNTKNFLLDSSITVLSTIQDTMSAIQKNIDALQDKNSKLFGIELIDNNTPVFNITSNQYVRDKSVLNKITSSFNLNIQSGVSDYPIQTLHGSTLDTIDNFVVQNASSFKAENLSLINQNLMSITFNKFLDIENLPDKKYFFVTVNGINNPITEFSTRIHGDKIIGRSFILLTVQNSYNDGDLVSIQYLDPTKNNDSKALQDTSGNDLNSFYFDKIATPSNVTLPSNINLNGLSIQGNSLIIRYSNITLDNINLPSIDSFNVIANGVLIPVSSIKVDRGNVTMFSNDLILTLKSSVQRSDVVTLNYKDPSSENDLFAIQDLNGNDANSFSKSVENVTGPSCAFFSSFVDGNLLSLSFQCSNGFDINNLPKLNSFSIKVNGYDVQVTKILGFENFNSYGFESINSFKVLKLELAKPVRSGDTVRVSYVDPTINNDKYAIQDVDGNDAATFIDQLIAISKPVVEQAIAFDSLHLYIRLSMALDAIHIPNPNMFEVTVNNSLDTVQQISVDPSNPNYLILTIADPVKEGDDIKVSYRTSHISTVQSTVGGLLTFTGTPNELDLNGTTSTTVSYDVSHANEVVKIINFQKNLDTLSFNNLGVNKLQTLDTRTDGQIATYIHSNADSEHGVVIVGVHSADLQIAGGLVTLA